MRRAARAVGRVCAPHHAAHRLTAAPRGLQDVFSLGCVLAELFLEGQPLFDYSRLLAYRQVRLHLCIVVWC